MRDIFRTASTTTGRIGGSRTLSPVSILMFSIMLYGSSAWSQVQQVGLVLKSRTETEGSAPQRSAYEQIVDPVDGSTADDLIRYALTHNGELAAAREMINDARGKLRQATLRANPMIEASGSHALTGPDNNVVFGAELPLELGGRRAARAEVAQREI